MDTPTEKAAVKANIKLADSAATLKDSAQEQTESAERRTVLAANRTVLAAERTYAAWIRTGLTALASGIGARAVLTDIVPEWIITASGSLLVLFSTFCFIAAVWRELRPKIAPPKPEFERLPSWLLIGISAVLVLITFSALAGIWMHA